VIFQYNAESKVNRTTDMEKGIRLYFLVSGLLLSGALAFAQEVTIPVAEVGVNYSFVRHNSAQGLREFTENGGSAYFEYNLNKVVGLRGDLGGYYNGTNSYKTGLAEEAMVVDRKNASGIPIGAHQPLPSFFRNSRKPPRLGDD
jgi:hypothetical protein